MDKLNNSVRHPIQNDNLTVIRKNRNTIQEVPRINHSTRRKVSTRRLEADPLIESWGNPTGQWL